MIHIVFSSSAAGIMRQMLTARGQVERVVDFHLSLNWGPIGLIDFLGNRELWFNRNVSDEHGRHDWFAESAGAFRNRVIADTDRLVWIAPGNASELVGLYWYLDQFGDVTPRMIVADYPLRTALRGEVPSALGSLDVAAMADLYDNCPRTHWDRVRFPASRWQELVADDALLRIMDGHAVRSAPPDYFDHYLLNRCSTEWTRWQRVVGNTMGDIWDVGQSIDDQFLLWRLLELIKSGDIEGNRRPQTNLLNRDDVLKVRLPQSTGA